MSIFQKHLCTKCSKNNNDTEEKLSCFEQLNSDSLPSKN